MTGRPFWVGLKATLEKIGIPQGENNHNQNSVLIFLFVCLFFWRAISKKANTPMHIGEKVQNAIQCSARVEGKNADPFFDSGWFVAG